MWDLLDQVMVDSNLFYSYCPNFRRTTVQNPSIDQFGIAELHRPDSFSRSPAGSSFSQVTDSAI